MTKLGIIVPCYNEEEVLQDSSQKLLAVLNNLEKENLVSNDSFICFVDDGSKDKTWDIIIKLKEVHPEIKGIKLSSNNGHQNALMAGLLTCKNDADCLVSIDADLQDEETTIKEMIIKFNKGFDIVYGVRGDRRKDSIFKRSSASFFYRFMKLLGVDIIYNHADFRLSSKKVNNELSKYKEINLFLRGIFPSMGFRSCEVYYSRQKRKAGKTKYPLKKMISFALNGISSFSIRPLRWITVTGFIIFAFCILASAYALWGYFYQETVPGWLSTVLPFYFLGGVQILCIGIIGEYIGKMYKEVKQRPRYIIEEEI